jgi:F-type H+-transporting ATPase subunit delta
MDPQRTVARPYAKAIFEWALQEKALSLWSEALGLLATVAKEESMQEVYQDARFSISELKEIFILVLKKTNLYHKNIENLILLLSHYRRLPLLPAIAMLFEEQKAEYEKTMHVYVTSAFPIENTLHERLKKAFEIRLQCHNVKLYFDIDKELIGGAVIRADDLVIDGSVKGQLEKLKQVVTN